MPAVRGLLCLLASVLLLLLRVPVPEAAEQWAHRGKLDVLTKDSPDYKKLSRPPEPGE